MAYARILSFRKVGKAPLKPKKADDNELEHIKQMMEQTLQNQLSALEELKNELKRMGGRVVESDHACTLDNIGSQYDPNQYSLSPSKLRQFLKDSGQWSSSDEDESSSF